MTKLPDNVRAAQDRLSDMFRTLPKKLGYTDLQSEVDWQTIRDYLVRQAANAARYVWLRDAAWKVPPKGDTPAALMVGPNGTPLRFPNASVLDGDGLDQAIDAAMLADAAREG